MSQAIATLFYQLFSVADKGAIDRFRVKIKCEKILIVSEM
jgi:hypothetical protein